MKFHSRLKATIESTTHNSTSPHDAVMATPSARHDLAKFSYPSSRSTVAFFFILMCLFRHLVFYCYYFCNNHTQTHTPIYANTQGSSLFTTMCWRLLLFAPVSSCRDETHTQIHERDSQTRPSTLPSSFGQKGAYFFLPNLLLPKAGDSTIAPRRYTPHYTLLQLRGERREREREQKKKTAKNHTMANYA